MTFLHDQAGDMLPRSFRRAQETRGRIRTYALVVGLAAFGVLWASGREFTTARELKAELTAARVHRNEGERLQQLLTRVGNEIVRLETETLEKGRLMFVNEPLRVLLLLNALREQRGGSVTLDRFTYRAEATQIDRKQTPNAEEPARIVEFGGSAGSDGVVEEFLARLRGVGLFHEVVLLSATSSAKGMVTFQVHAEF